MVETRIVPSSEMASCKKTIMSAEHYIPFHKIYDCMSRKDIEEIFQSHCAGGSNVKVANKLGLTLGQVSYVIGKETDRLEGVLKDLHKDDKSTGDESNG